MTIDGYFLSTRNPVANTDQRNMEDRALRLVKRPEIERARTLATFLWREVVKHPHSDQMDRFDNMIEEYVFHYLMRAVASDGNFPGVVRFMTPAHHWFGRDVPGSRWGGDSPDFTYRIIPVSHGGRYDIHGRPTCASPPTAFYALMGDNTAAPTIMSLLDGLDIEKDANSEFVITVDAEPANGRKNHIQTRPGCLQIWVRDALSDWVEQTPNILRINRLNPPQREPLSDEEVTQMAAKGLVDGVYYSYYVGRSTSSLPPNVVEPPASSGPFGGMASQYTGKCNIVLEADEAMIMTASSAGALFRNAVLHDAFLLSLDYWNRTGNLNSSQMAADDGGLFTYVVSHRDPGVHNWLDTGGVRQTIFGQRWQSFPGGSASEVPTISGRVVKFKDLEKELPGGAKRIDAAGRRDQLASRKAGFMKRFIDN